MTAAAHQRGAHEAELEGASRLVERPAFGRASFREARRQRRRRHDAALRGPHRQSGQHVLQLAHVAGPVVARQRGHRGRAKAGAAADAIRGVAPEMLGEHRHVLAPLAQRRHGDVHDVEAIEKIEAEAAGLDLPRERAVGRRHDAHVDASRDILADAAQLAVLDHAQHLGLRARRQLADFVEEQRAAVRFLEHARRARPRPR